MSRWEFYKLRRYSCRMVRECIRDCPDAWERDTYHFRLKDSHISFWIANGPTFFRLEGPLKEVGWGFGTWRIWWAFKRWDRRHNAMLDANVHNLIAEEMKKARNEPARQSD